MTRCRAIQSDIVHVRSVPRCETIYDTPGVPLSLPSRRSTSALVHSPRCGQADSCKSPSRTSASRSCNKTYESIAGTP
ncbi:hypothetical protein PUN28_005423 [Cardiocondyla obscurior]|uniref:Uncharacterized protein n=1 Tax=Cardiocondyla obscurior TaxID=286306 RepID=A0AAW2GHJ7_9HYME